MKERYMKANSCELRTVPSIRVAWGEAGRLGQLLASTFSQCSVLIVGDAGLVNIGLIEPIAVNVRANGFPVAIFDGVVAGPFDNVVPAAVGYGRQIKPNTVVGLGGGSSLDMAKILAVLLNFEQRMTAIFGIDKVQESRLPLVQIPTTSGIDSKVTNISIVTTGAAAKMGVVAPQLYADLVLIDAQLTLGLPSIATTASGSDAKVHTIEACTSKIKKNPISDASAHEALQMLSVHLQTACQDAQNREAHEALLLRATLLGLAFANSQVAAVHALANPVGSHCHVGHRFSNAFMPGPVLRFNTSAAAHQYAELAGVMGDPDHGQTKEQTDDFIQAIEILTAESGALRRPRDAGFVEESLDMLADEAMKQTRFLINKLIYLQRSEPLLANYHEAY